MLDPTEGEKRKGGEDEHEELEDERRFAMTLIPGEDAVGALEDPEELEGLYRGICAALGLEPEPEDADGAPVGGTG